MIIKIFIAVFCVAFVTGLGSTRHSQQTKTTNKVSQKQSSPKQQELQNYHMTDKIRPSTGYYQHTSVRQFESSRTGYHEPITRHNQPRSDQHEQIIDQHQPTQGRFQTTDDNHHTMGYLHMTSGHHQPSTDNSQTRTGKYKQITGKNPANASPTGKNPASSSPTGKNMAIAQLFQSWSKFKSSQQPSSEYPQNDGSTKSASVVDGLIIPGVFLCKDGKFRIYSSKICDGQIDCPDSSDELPDLCTTSNLVTTKCRINEFQCPSGKCVPNDSIRFSDMECWRGNGSGGDNFGQNCSYPNLLCDNNTKCVSEEDRCNGLWDCQDHTDETISPFTFITHNLSFKCANGYCVSPKVLCNGDNDCGDNSDEISCRDYKTTKQQSFDHPCTQYMCNSGECILRNQACNGDNDCGDNSDEAQCDESAWFLSDNRGLIICVSVLGGAVLITIGAVICVKLHYKWKYRTLTQETNRTDSRPPSYWQVVGISAPDPLEKAEQKTISQVNILHGGTTAFPE